MTLPGLLLRKYVQVQCKMHCEKCCMKQHFYCHGAAKFEREDFQKKDWCKMKWFSCSIGFRWNLLQNK